MNALTNYFVYDFDREELEEKARKWGGLIAGGLFGCGTCHWFRFSRSNYRITFKIYTIGWWSWADAIVKQSFVEQASKTPAKYAWPGIVATLSLILINMLPRDELQDISDSGDDETNMRARLWLLCSFLLAFGSIAGSIAVLISCTEAEHYVAIGVGSVMQCGFILASALILWAYRTRSL